MNTQHKSLVPMISKTETKTSTTGLYETVSNNMKQLNSITVADLWNIQRGKRSIYQRKYFSY